MSGVKRLTHEIRQRSLWQRAGTCLARARVGFQGPSFASGLSPDKGVPGLTVAAAIPQPREE